MKENSGYLTEEEFLNYLQVNFDFDNMISSPETDNDGNRLWAVSTSNDNLFISNKKKYKEGSIYILPKAINVKSKKFVGWYNMTDGKIYKEGDLVIINCGTHFEAIWK